MTEHRSPYQAFSGTYPSRRIDPRFAGIPETRDILLLLPILQSPHADDLYAPCLQLIHLEDGKLGFCNTLAEWHCACCGHSACDAHQHLGTLSFVDETGTRYDSSDATLCETCAHLDTFTRSALSTFRRLINSHEGRVEHGL